MSKVANCRWANEQEFGSSIVGARLAGDNQSGQNARATGDLAGWHIEHGFEIV